MQIYVVQRGDTLSEISDAYNIPSDLLITSNNIENPNDLVPGQTIVIPIWGFYYFVEEGDTLFTISREFNIPTEQIIRINQISNPEAVLPGTRLYLPQRPRTAIYSGGYIDTDITGENSPETLLEVGDLLSTVQIFSYQVNSMGELREPRFDEEVIVAAAQTNTRPLMVITNIEDGGFSTEAATAILTNEDLRKSLLDEIIDIMNEKGYKGLDIDFEYLGAENREPYNNFLVEAKARLDNFGYSLSTALAPKIEEDQIGILYEGHDYEFHGSVADYIFIMTYEWGWTGGPPRAVAPLNEVRRVLDYAITAIPREKIMMGIPLYGYDWTLPFVEGESRARAISPNQAIAIAAQYGVEIQYDPEAASPFFRYVDEEGREHEVWFEDARSIQAKFDLVKELGIRGFYYWVLGRDFPQNWLLVEDNFIIKKY